VAGAGRRPDGESVGVGWAGGGRTEEGEQLAKLRVELRNLRQLSFRRQRLDARG